VVGREYEWAFPTAPSGVNGEAQAAVGRRAEAAPRIVIVDADVALRTSLARTLGRQSVAVDAAADVDAALESIRAGMVDMVIADPPAAEGSTFDLCRRIRRESDVAILIVTARALPAERVAGLDAGADDYVVKPFFEAEVLGRVRAILRRTQGARLATQSVKQLGDLEIDLAHHRVRVGGCRVALTLTESRLLALLVQHPGRVYSRREILGHLWETSHLGDERACDAHISHLRRKIERDPGNPERIVTVRGRGYALVPSDPPMGSSASWPREADAKRRAVAVCSVAEYRRDRTQDL
jgi:DNA-binding response OmpR family regulator